MIKDIQSIYKTEDNLFPPKKTLQIKGKLFCLDKPWIMGILNVTPDSFFSGNRFYMDRAALEDKAAEMLEEGTNILDIGGYSSRPGAAEVSEKSELDRVIPVISSIKKSFPNALISVDTFRHKVAKEAVQAGADIVNDISGGGLDERMFETVGELAVPYICMHMRGTPSTMQKLTDYGDLEKDMLEYFSLKLERCHQAGIKDVILDIGLGFSKTLEQNYRLIKNLTYFKTLQSPILVGASRKSMIYKLLESTPEESLNATTALHMAALINGADILRVHDVKEANEALTIYKQLYN
ncbi:dihydropteroate synthase [Negadavirga shengliensis]|uniref:dihydropteroate synthase n=1 Tax=Negadavirga shengliensis TaxID=1389218 RepID=A0ABV9T5A1_9BACT